jgi:hypothetical protein
MAVVSVSEIPESRGGSWNRLWQRLYTRSFRVECSDPADGPVAIRMGTNGPSQPTLPGVGNSYFVNSVEKDFGSFAADVSYRWETITAGGGCAWIVSVSYGPYDANQFSQTPTDWPIKVSFSSVKFERALLYDQSNTPIVNSAGDPFKDPVTLDNSRPILRVVRNERIQGFNFLLSEQYRDKVNNALWNGFATKTVKCSGIETSDPQYDSNNQWWYYAVSYVFEVDRDTWQAKLLDVGVNFLDGSGKPQPFRDAKGQKKDDGTLLDGSGHKLAGGGTPVYFNFDVYPSVDFTAFNLDFNTALGR